MRPENLIQFPESTFAFDLPDTERTSVLSYSHADQHGDFETSFWYRKLQRVRVSSFHVAYIDRVAATIDDYRDVIPGTQRIV